MAHLYVAWWQSRNQRARPLRRHPDAVTVLWQPASAAARTWQPWEL